jgi:hypothetical protein
VLALLAACGRIGFDGLTGDAPPVGDPFPDTSGPALVQTLSIAAPGDDGEVDPGAWYPEGEFGLRFLYAGAWYNDWTWVYLRFALDTEIPADATIQSAALAVFGAPPQGWGPGKHLVIYAELDPDPLVVSGLLDRPTQTGGRALTAVSVLWPPAGDLSWSAGAWNTTPDLAQLLQPLVSQFGTRSAGTHVQLWIRGDDNSSNAEIALEDVTHAGDHPAALHVEWTVP